jgi:hypothetical protein
MNHLILREPAIVSGNDQVIRRDRAGGLLIHDDRGGT